MVLILKLCEFFFGKKNDLFGMDVGYWEILIVLL